MLSIRPATRFDLESERFVEIVGRAMGQSNRMRITEFVAKAQSNGASILVACSVGQIVGALTSEQRGNGSVEITNVATAEAMERRGVGAGLVSELRSRSKGVPVFAETDEDAVGFYRALGFTVHSLGEKYPGTVRYRCVLEPSKLGDVPKQ